MRSAVRRVLLFAVDAAAMYLSYYVSYLILDLLGQSVSNDLISVAYIPVAIKLFFYLLFFMYSLNRYRSLMIDAIGVIMANVVAAFALQYLSQITIDGRLFYYALVMLFDLITALLFRYLVRTPDLDSEEDEDEEGDESEEMDDIYKNQLFDRTYVQSPDPQPLQPAQTPQVSREEFLSAQKEKDAKIDRLIDELNRKEDRIKALENKLSMQSAMAYNNSETYIERNKKEMLDKILDDVKSLYSTLNTRTKMVEDREYNLLLKMVELEEKQRALDEIQTASRYILPERRSKKRYEKRKPEKRFSDIENLPSDNPDLADNILKAIEKLDASGPVISAARQAPQIHPAPQEQGEEYFLKEPVRPMRPKQPRTVPQQTQQREKLPPRSRKGRLRTIGAEGSTEKRTRCPSSSEADGDTAELLSRKKVRLYSRAEPPKPQEKCTDGQDREGTAVQCGKTDHVNRRLFQIRLLKIRPPRANSLKHKSNKKTVQEQKQPRPKTGKGECGFLLGKNTPKAEFGYRGFFRDIFFNRFALERLASL